MARLQLRRGTVESRTTGGPPSCVLTPPMPRGKSTPPLHARDAKRVAARLKQARERLSLSLRDLGDLAGIPWGTLAAVERGREPRWSTLMRYLSLVPGLRAGEFLPTPSVQPPEASESVYAFMLDAIGFGADEVHLRLTVNKDGSAVLRREVTRLRAQRDDEEFEMQAKALLQIACVGGNDLVRHLIHDALPEGRFRREEGGVAHEFTLSKPGKPACVRYVRVERLPPGAVRDEVRLDVGHPVERMRLEAVLPSGTLPSDARAHVWLFSRATEQEEGDLCSWLHPRGLRIATDPATRKVSLDVERVLPDLTYCLRWTSAKMSRPAPPALETAPDVRVPRTFAPIARRLRERACLSQRQLADAMGVVHGTVAEAERGRDPRAGTLLRYLEALPGTPPQVLLPSRAAEGTLTTEEAWAYYRDLHRLECTELRRRYTVRPDGTTEMLEEYLDVRSLSTEGRTVRVVLGAQRSIYVKVASRVEDLHVSEEMEEDVRTRRVGATEAGPVHEFTIPGRSSRRALSWSVRTVNPGRLSLTAAEGKARAATSLHVSQGTSATPIVPCRRLVVEALLATAQESTLEVAVAIPAIRPPHRMVPPVLEHLHEGRFRFECDRAARRLKLEVEHPLCAISYGVAWRLK